MGKKGNKQKRYIAEFKISVVMGGVIAPNQGIC